MLNPKQHSDFNEALTFFSLSLIFSLLFSTESEKKYLQFSIYFFLFVREFLIFLIFVYICTMLANFVTLYNSWYQIITLDVDVSTLVQ